MKSTDCGCSGHLLWFSTLGSYLTVADRPTTAQAGVAHRPVIPHFSHSLHLQLTQSAGRWPVCLAFKEFDQLSIWLQILQSVTWKATVLQSNILPTVWTQYAPFCISCWTTSLDIHPPNDFIFSLQCLVESGCFVTKSLALKTGLPHKCILGVQLLPFLRKHLQNSGSSAD